MFKLRNFITIALLASVLMIVSISMSFAQSPSGVVITSPESVTELYGDVTIKGTAAVPGMLYYYLEIHPMDSLTLDEDTPWLPITVAYEQPVVDDVLATFDTTRVDDGVYLLRMVVNVADGSSHYVYVGPIRVSNIRFENLINTESIPEAVQLPEVPADAPTPTGVTATSFQPGLTSPNVRYCDIVDNQRCPVIDNLDRNETARLVARSARTGGWYKIRLNSGHEGWIADSVIIVQGDTSTLPTETPPDPRPVTIVQQPVQQPLQPGQATVITSTQAFPDGISIDGGNARCNETFNVHINITNPSDTVVSQGGQVSLQDVNIRTGEITATGYGTFPNLNPRANYVVVIPIHTAVYYSEAHELRARAGGHDVRLSYTLDRGNCDQPSNNHNNNNNNNNSTSLDCRLTSSTGSFEGYDSPGAGEVSAVIQGGQITGEERRNSGGLVWYRVTYLDTQLWVPKANYISTSGNC
jgi:hypothetical protein